MVPALFGAVPVNPWGFEMGDDNTPPSLDDLEERLDAARRRRTGGRSTGRDDAPAESGVSLAFRIGVEMVSALAIGVGIGLLLDWWLETRPWFLVVFLVLGAAAGVLNVYRATRGFGLAVGYRKLEAGEDENSETGVKPDGVSDKSGGPGGTLGKQGER